MKWTLDTLLSGFPGTSNKTSLGMSSVTLASCNDVHVILDTAGFGARKIIIEELNHRGFKPEDISYVFISHLHFDHVANFDLFPNAEFVFSEVDWDYANSADDIYVQKIIIKELANYKLRKVEDGCEILPGVKGIITPGHTPGCMTYLFDTDDGVIAFAGDAIKNRVELSLGEVGMTYDSELSYKTIMRVREMADYVIPGHDCTMSTKDGKVVPLEKNALVVTFQKHLCANGGLGVVAIELDEL